MCIICIKRARDVLLSIGYIAFFVICFGICTVCCSRVFAVQTISEGTCGARGDNLHWSFTENGVLTISGSGEMADYYKDSWIMRLDDPSNLPAPWRSLRDSIKQINIAAGVTSVGIRAFDGCSNLESVTISNDVVSIGEYAFLECGMKEVTIPGSVTVLTKHAFYDCYDLEKLTILPGMKAIGESAFLGCDHLTTIFFPTTLETIGKQAFDYCQRIKDVHYSGSEQQWKTVKIEQYNKYLTRANLNFNATIEHSHIYGNIMIGREATCAQTGYQYQICSICGIEGNKKTISKTAHQFQNRKIAATQKKDGSVFSQCIVCGSKKTKSVIPKVSVVSLAKKSFVFNGKKKEPKVIIKDSKDNYLKENRDYQLNYNEGRSECGKHSIKVVFKGNYQGTKTLSYSIILGQVTGLKQIKAKGLKLAWNAVTGADYYDVYCFDTELNKFRLMLGNCTGTVIEHPGIKNRSLRFKVRAVRETENAGLVRGKFSEVLKVNV